MKGMCAYKRASVQRPPSFSTMGRHNERTLAMNQSVFSRMQPYQHTDFGFPGFLNCKEKLQLVYPICGILLYWSID